MGDYAFLVNEGGTILQTSPGMTVNLQHNPEDLVSRNLIEYIHPEDRPRMEQRFQAILAFVPTQPGTESRIRSASGEYRWHEIRWMNCLDDPAVSAVVVIARDIDERKQVEAALRASE